MLEYYVYIHYCSITDNPIYVGKGKGNRAYCLKRNDFYNNYIKKYGEPKIVIVKDNITEKYAFLLEKAYIKIFGRRDLNEGPLTNLTDGGEGNKNITKKVHKERNRINHLKMKLCVDTWDFNVENNLTPDTMSFITGISKKIIIKHYEQYREYFKKVHGITPNEIKR